jgi:hypothetical protein
VEGKQAKLSNLHFSTVWNAVTQGIAGQNGMASSHSPGSINIQKGKEANKRVPHLNQI